MADATTAPPESSPVLPVAAGALVAVGTAEAFRGALVGVRNAAVLQTVATWRSVVTVADLLPTVRAFAVLTALVVAREQRRAVALADLYLATLLRTRPTGLDPIPFLGNPSTPAPLGAALASSSALVRHGLEQGADEGTALHRGLHRATRIVSTEVVRAGTDALAELAKDRTTGWRRHTGPDPCPICAGLADGTVNRWGEAVSAHPHCSCVQEVVTDDLA